jgi:chloride channel 3/4/5
MGYCSDGWWLNQQYCCWEIKDDEVDGCDSWHPWSQFTLVRWMTFVTFAVRFPPYILEFDSLLIIM